MKACLILKLLSPRLVPCIGPCIAIIERAGQARHTPELGSKGLMQLRSALWRLVQRYFCVQALWSPRRSPWRPRCPQPPSSGWLIGCQRRPCRCRSRSGRCWRWGMAQGRGRSCSTCRPRSAFGPSRPSWQATPSTEGMACELRCCSSSVLLSSLS